MAMPSPTRMGPNRPMPIIIIMLPTCFSIPNRGRLHAQRLSASSAILIILMGRCIHPTAHLINRPQPRLFSPRLARMAGAQEPFLRFLAIIITINSNTSSTTLHSSLTKLLSRYPPSLRRLRRPCPHTSRDHHAQHTKFPRAHPPRIPRTMIWQHVTITLRSPAPR